MKYIISNIRCDNGQNYSPIEVEAISVAEALFIANSKTESKIVRFDIEHKYTDELNEYIRTHSNSALYMYVVLDIDGNYVLKNNVFEDVAYYNYNDCKKDIYNFIRMFDAGVRAGKE